MLLVFPSRVQSHGVTSGVKTVISRKNVASMRFATSTFPR